MGDSFGIFGLTFDNVFPWVNTLGWALIHFLWQGVVIGVLFAAGRFALKNASPHARYYFGLLCLLLLLAAPIATFITLFDSDPQSSALNIAAFSDTARVAASLTSDFEISQWIESALPWVVLAWTLGVLLMSSRASFNWYLIQRCIRVGVRPVNTEIESRTELLRELFGIRRVVTVVESTLVHVPMVFGWFKPVILIPTSSLVGLTPAQLELVIAHELGHVRRFDYVVNLFQVAVETLLFYHPVVGWISRQVRDEREQCCDDLVVATCGNRLEYAKALTNLESMRSGSLAPALAATDGQLLHRIERIVCAHGQERESLLGNSGLLLVIAFALIIAGRVADPMAAFEARRSQLADNLFAQLASDSDETPFVSLEEVSVTVMEPEQTVERAAAADITMSDNFPLLPSNQRAPAAAVSIQLPEAMDEAVQKAAEPDLRSASGSNNQASDASADHQTSAEGAAELAPIELAVQRLPTPASLHAAEQPGRNSTAPFQGSTADSGAGSGTDSSTGPGTVAEAVATLDVAMIPKAVIPTAPQPPVAIHRVSPEYPRRARMTEAQGWVELEYTLKSNGRVAGVQVLDASPRRIFDKAARRALKKWRFDPATVVPGQSYTKTFEFVLEGEPVEQEAPDWRGCVPATGSRICRASSPIPLSSSQ